MSVAVVIGTRPEAVKLAGVVELLGDEAWVVHTGQHHDPRLTDGVHDAVGVEPVTVLGVAASGRAGLLAAMTGGLDQLFAERRPTAVVVQGDTTSVLAGALVANAHELPLLHVEAGLRSRDRRMPEEHHRIVADHLADWLGAPTQAARANLLAEGIPDDRIEVTGNTVVEATRTNLPDETAVAALREEHGVGDGPYVVATFHRPENVDDPVVLATIVTELASLPVPVVLPAHPRTLDRLSELDAAARAAWDRLLVVPPLPPDEFVGLCSAAAVLVSDSGGVQEEASVLQRPVVVVRRSTERPEVLGTFAELHRPGPSVGEAVRRLLDDLPAVHRRLAALTTPYGDGSASERTVAAIRRLTVEP